MTDYANQDHYTAHDLEPIDVMRATLTREEMRGFLRGNIIKYTMRWPYKGQAVSDLEKLKVYADWMIIHINEEAGP